MSGLILLAVVVIIGLIARKFILERREEHLKNNPPTRRIVRVSLPVGVGNISPKQMTRFFRQAASSSLGDKKERRAGTRQVDIIYLINVPAPGSDPEMTFLMSADEDKMDSLKRSIKQVFDGMAEVNELDENQFEEIANKLKKTDTSEPEDIVGR